MRVCISEPPPLSIVFNRSMFGTFFFRCIFVLAECFESVECILISFAIFDPVTTSRLQDWLFNDARCILIMGWFSVFSRTI